jgi:hypothetical protein
MILVELFTSADCRHCDEARAVLERMQASIPFTLSEIRIHAGDTWYDEYHELVPVVHINRVPVFKHRLVEGMLRIRLQQIAAGTARPAAEEDQDAGEVVK